MTGAAARSAACHARAHWAPMALPVVPPLPDLPVRAVLGAVTDALAAHGGAVLVAPPGTGKTTLVPLALAADRGRVLVAEPRRLATRAAAARMATLLGEPVGETVGYAVRGDTRRSDRTRIEVVTSGLLLRRLMADPELDGVHTVLLDECHERHLDADLLLALLLDARAGLRPDLRLLATSATVATDRLAEMLGGAAVVRVEARMFPVATTYLPPARGERIETCVARAVRRAVQDGDGDVLAFLPGVPEIRRTAGLLADVGPADVDVVQLHGRLPAAEQDLALTPGPRRRVVLATAVAESSLTVPGVRAVVDAGLARTPRTDHRRGLAGLVTVRVSAAVAEQRAGRAGREAPGRVYRCWPEGELLARYPEPEIRTADLTRLALDLACWGTPDGSGLALVGPAAHRPAAGRAAGAARPGGGGRRRCHRPGAAAGRARAAPAAGPCAAGRGDAGRCADGRRGGGADRRRHAGRGRRGRRRAAPVAVRRRPRAGAGAPRSPGCGAWRPERRAPPDRGGGGRPGRRARLSRAARASAVGRRRRAAAAPRRLPHVRRHGRGAACREPVGGPGMAGGGPRGSDAGRGARADPAGRRRGSGAGRTGRARAARRGGRGALGRRRRRRPPGAQARRDRAERASPRRTPTPTPSRRLCGTGCAAKASGCCGGASTPDGCATGSPPCTACSATARMAAGPTCPTPPSSPTPTGGGSLPGPRPQPRRSLPGRRRRRPAHAARPPTGRPPGRARPGADPGALRGPDRRGLLRRPAGARGEGAGGLRLDRHPDRRRGQAARRVAPAVARGQACRGHRGPDVVLGQRLSPGAGRAAGSLPKTRGPKILSSRRTDHRAGPADPRRRMRSISSAA